MASISDRDLEIRLFLPFFAKIKSSRKAPSVAVMIEPTGPLPLFHNLAIANASRALARKTQHPSALR
jgi:hypothetical protein